MLARLGVMAALNQHVQQKFNPIRRCRIGGSASSLSFKVTQRNRGFVHQDHSVRGLFRFKHCAATAILFPDR